MKKMVRSNLCGIAMIERLWPRRTSSTLKLRLENESRAAGHVGKFTEQASHIRVTFAGAS